MNKYLRHQMLCGDDSLRLEIARATVDSDTIVTKALHGDHWQCNVASDAISSAADGGGHTLLNNELASDAVLYRCHQFVAPPGCTQVTVAYDVRTGVDADSGHQIQVAVEARDLSSAITTDTARTLTDTVTSYSFSAAVTAGTEYAVVFYLANAAIGTENRCQVSDFSVSIDAGTGVFAGSFQRIAVDADSLDLCSSLNPPAYEHNAFVVGSCLSRVRMKTVATDFAVEHRLNLASTRETYGDIGLFDEYFPVDHIQTTSSTQAYIGTLAGINSGLRIVDVVNGYQQDITPGVTFASMARAIYLADPAVKIYKTTPDIVIYGDSVICGRNSESPCNDGAPAWLRNATVDAACDGRGSSRMKDDCETAGDRTAYAAHLASYGAHWYYIEHGSNDFAQPSIWSAANFGAAYADLLDKIRATDGSAKIVCQLPITFPYETANDYGDTLDDYRAQITTAANARSYCTLVDGRTFLDSPEDYNQSSPYIHPTTIGNLKLAEGVKDAIPSLFTAAPPVISEADAEYQCNDGDVHTLVDHSGNQHHGQFGTDELANVNDPTWDENGYIDFTSAGLVLLPGTYKTLIGTGALTLFGVVQIGTIEYPYLFGCNPPAGAMQVYGQSADRKFAVSANPAKANGSAVVAADSWHFVMGVFEPSTRVTLWTTAPGTLTKEDEDTSSVPASQPAITGYYIGNDVRANHQMAKIAYAGVISGAVADADVPSIYARVKAAMTAKPTPIVLP